MPRALFDPEAGWIPMSQTIALLCPNAATVISNRLCRLLRVFRIFALARQAQPQSLHYQTTSP